MTIDRETKVGAIADYLLGFRNKTIANKWGICETTLSSWIAGLRDHFKPKSTRNKSDNDPSGLLG